MSEEFNKERTLVSIQKISDIQPIPGADAIEVATVLGWEVVVKKDEFKVGDFAVYFEIDSFLPFHPVWSFLEKSCARKMGDKTGLRLKTIRLRGQVSQGLIISPDVIFNRETHFQEGDDVTELLGVEKWDPPLPANLGGVARGNFPSFIPKTDQPRIQNCFNRLAKNNRFDTWEESLKMDGSSCTIYLKSSDDYSTTTFGVCSRNLDLVETESNSFWSIARQYDLENKMLELGYQDFAIQGELCGPGIQKNFEKLDQTDLFVFDIWDIRHRCYVAPEVRLHMTSALGLKNVKIHDHARTLDFDNVKSILELAEGPGYNRKDREGIVFKSNENPGISFKAISQSYLLKHEE